jgi:toxin ParE1/3/4
MTGTATRPVPSALPPNEEELAAWRGLPRHEQIARYREALLTPEAGRVSQTTMADVLIAARQRVAARGGWVPPVGAGGAEPHRDLWHTAQCFGAYQAEAYHAGFERIFDLLARFPLIGRLIEEIAPRFRRFRFQAHTVFYTEEADFVLIRAILHGAREVKPDFSIEASHGGEDGVQEVWRHDTAVLIVWCLASLSTGYSQTFDPLSPSHRKAERFSLARMMNALGVTQIVSACVTSTGKLPEIIIQAGLPASSGGG